MIRKLKIEPKCPECGRPMSKCECVDECANKPKFVDIKFGF